MAILSEGGEAIEIFEVAGSGLVCLFPDGPSSDISAAG